MGCGNRRCSGGPCRASTPRWKAREREKERSAAASSKRHGGTAHTPMQVQDDLFAEGRRSLGTRPSLRTSFPGPIPGHRHGLGPNHLNPRLELAVQFSRGQNRRDVECGAVSVAQGHEGRAVRDAGGARLGGDQSHAHVQTVEQCANKTDVDLSARESVNERKRSHGRGPTPHSRSEPTSRKGAAGTAGGDGARSKTVHGW